MTPTTAKRCRKCGETKSLAEFHRDVTMGDGWCTQCKPCKLAAQRARRAADPDSERAKQRAFYAKHRERRLEQGRTWKRKNPRYHFEYRIRAYGLTSVEWDAMLVAQSGRCAICAEPMREPCVDHCHDTEQVRELLCRPCNVGIGNLGDCSARARAAAEYLERHGR